MIRIIPPQSSARSLRAIPHPNRIPNISPINDKAKDAMSSKMEEVKNSASEAKNAAADKAAEAKDAAADKAAEVKDAVTK